MVIDALAYHSDGLSAPSRAAFAVVPSDSATLPLVTKAIYVGSGGHVTVHPIDSVIDVTYRNVPGGAYLTVRASHVRATGTTATDIVGEA